MNTSDVSNVAVVYSGWLGVRLPRGARRHLIDALRADVFVAGTFKPGECDDGQCLMRRLHHLQPLARMSLAPMLTHEQLRVLAHGAPAFSRVASNFNINETYGGLNMFSPVIGNPSVHIMRELHDYKRAYELLVAHERDSRAGRLYERVVFSRLELVWLAAHPPLSALPLSTLWVPSGQLITGTNDRHAVMSRAAAPTYFLRWDLLMGPDVLPAFGVASMAHWGAEPEHARRLPIPVRSAVRAVPR